MPKLKTHSGASKRFKQTASGKFKHKSTNMRHLLRKRDKTQKRHLNVDNVVKPCDEFRVKAMFNL